MNRQRHVRFWKGFGLIFAVVITVLFGNILVPVYAFGLSVVFIAYLYWVICDKFDFIVGWLGSLIITSFVVMLFMERIISYPEFLTTIWWL